MSELKATPGPWNVCSGNRKAQGICTCFTVSCADHPIADVAHGEWGDSYPSLRFVADTTTLDRKVEAYMEHTAYGSIPESQAVANAHLLSASWDLYHALDAIVPPMCPIVTHHKPDCVWCAGMKALAKARGEQ